LKWRAGGGFVRGDIVVAVAIEEGEVFRGAVELTAQDLVIAVSVESTHPFITG